MAIKIIKTLISNIKDSVKNLYNSGSALRTRDGNGYVLFSRSRNSTESDITFDLIRSIAMSTYGMKEVTTAYYPNMIGIRNNTVREYGRFDDWLLVYYYGEDGSLWYKIYGMHTPILRIDGTGEDFTTDPGLYYAKNPINKSGVGILCEGFYEGVWVLGKHKGKYPAFLQLGNEVRVYRDNNRDSYMDLDKARVMRGYFGCNLHHANDTSGLVDRWSAMCQVLRYSTQLEEILSLARKSKESRFNYTLIKLTDIDRAGNNI